ncbi:sigma 54-interacting transcriptional regulator [Chitinispirillales bacterium ANBcel5]|uniref:sigma 54-interacting transcriptional regulator n=1 Tax=Cellulosispirillum alkaliphilum TaxID=3039283 RepID=UPI002A542036|nr:sigma 54-interacting transcriptional regulator [Chitinispirillales bacterium ANBcel5]
MATQINPELSFNGLTVLYKIAQQLASGNELEEMMSAILEILENNAGMKRGMISILSPKKEELTVDVARGISESEKRKGRYKPGEGITGRVVASGRPVAVPTLESEPTFLDRTGARKGLRQSDLSFLCVPIKAEDVVVGALSVDKLAVEDAVTLEGELRFLEAVADLIAQAVQCRRRQYDLIQALERENTELRRSLEDKGKPDQMIGNSSTMRDAYRQIAMVAPSVTSVLIRGETGTGKELVARAIHQKSPRKDKAFVAVNCAALPESLLESELFGHEKGSFTGATSKRIGRFEAADGGTLFLDEIGEMPPSAQSRLLRAIQEKEFQRVGGTDAIKVDVRLICATNRNLESDVQQARFREDLYYRINVFTIILPPLRERGADVLLLADYFVRKYSKLHDKPIERISTPAIDMISAYHWPGNVRELENVMERSVIVATGTVIDGHDLPPTLQVKDIVSQSKRKDTFDNLVAAYERELIIDALKDKKGNQTEAAKLLGTTKRIIQYKINKYNIDFTRFKGGETEL